MIDDLRFESPNKGRGPAASLAPASRVPTCETKPNLGGLGYLGGGTSVEPSVRNKANLHAERNRWGQAPPYERVRLRQTNPISPGQPGGWGLWEGQMCETEPPEMVCDAHPTNCGGAAGAIMRNKANFRPDGHRQSPAGPLVPPAGRLYKQSQFAGAPGNGRGPVVQTNPIGRSRSCETKPIPMLAGKNGVRCTPCQLRRCRRADARNKANFGSSGRADGRGISYRMPAGPLCWFLFTPFSRGR